MIERKKEEKNSFLSMYLGLVTTVMVVMIGAQWSENHSFQVRIEDKFYEHDKMLNQHEVMLEKIEYQLSQGTPDKEKKETKNFDIAIINESTNKKKSKL